MKALILAAGYGTRLYPLTEDTPKPLLPVGPKLLVDHILDKIKALPGLDEVLVITNDKFEGHFQKWAKEIAKKFPVPITIINDRTTSNEDRLGSVGDINFAVRDRKINADLLVLGGDNLFDYSLADFLKFARAKAPAVSIGLYDIHNLRDATMYGVAQLDSQGKVVLFEEKPAKPKSTLIAMCFYYFPYKTLAYLPEYIKASGKLDKAGDYIRWLAEEKGVYGFKFDGKWYDIGSLEAYRDAQRDFK